jgi:hypothetical protein
LLKVALNTINQSKPHLYTHLYPLNDILHDSDLQKDTFISKFTFETCLQFVETL